MKRPSVAGLLWEMCGPPVAGTLAVVAAVPVAAFLLGYVARIVAELAALGWLAGWPR